ncbi:MAG TPA: hypothetical protein VEW69_05480, partial [Alphaproteobacteria bacterium]|nr:hypothetical protein [Alphaproteobacteria bacterium]
VVCLSTLEHVGLDNTRLYTSDQTKKEADASAYLEAVRELRRVLSPGGWAFISVPYGRRDVRDWLQVFDAEMVSALVSAFSPSTHAVTFFQYSDPEGWQLSTEVAARDAVYFDYYRDTPWPGCPAAAGAVACIELRKP